MTSFSPDRRKFLKLSAGMAGMSLVLGINWSCSADRSDSADTTGFVPNAWLRIDDNGVVTVRVAESEMGQGLFTQRSRGIDNIPTYGLSGTNVVRIIVSLRPTELSPGA